MEKTVGELAAESPSAVRVFEKYNIDYCCGGKFTLDEACRGRGIPPEQLLAELDRAARPQPGTAPDWQREPLDRLIDHILSRHHAYLKAELPRLAGMLERVQAAHLARHADSLAPLGRTFQALRGELESHLMKEEMVLFPVIRQMLEARDTGRPAPSACFGTVRNPIRMMEHEHDSAGEALGTIRSLTSGYAPPEDACNTYRALYQGLAELEADLHQHIHLENNILFPRATRLEAGE